jgi:hypothetical protein
MVDDARGADQEVQGQDPILTLTSPRNHAPAILALAPLRIIAVSVVRLDRAIDESPAADVCAALEI